jgi:fructoselysine 6-kinase
MKSISVHRRGRRPTIASTGLGALKSDPTDANLETQAPRQLSEMLGRPCGRKRINMKLAAMTVLCVDFYENQNIVCVGGNSVNFATQCTKDNVDKVSLIGAIGNDTYGNDILQYLSDYEIDKSHVYVLNGKTASNRILINDKGDRYFPDGAWDGGVYQTFILSEKDWSFTLSHDVIAIPANNINYKETIKRKTRNNFLTVDFLDLRDYQLMEDTIPYLDLAFISGDDEIIKYARKISKKIRTIVTVTLGSDGSISFYNGNEKYLPAVKVDDVKDTTGCGDAYQASFTVSYYRNRNIELAMDAGSNAAAKVLSHIGAITT